MHVTWDLWMDLYCETWCVVRNLKASTIRAYRDTLRQFKKWVQREHLIVRLKGSRKTGRCRTRRLTSVLIGSRSCLDGLLSNPPAADYNRNV